MENSKGRCISQKLTRGVRDDPENMHPGSSLPEVAGGSTRELFSPQQRLLLSQPWEGSCESHTFHKLLEPEILNSFLSLLNLYPLSNRQCFNLEDVATQ